MARDIKTMDIISQFLKIILKFRIQIILKLITSQIILIPSPYTVHKTYILKISHSIRTTITTSTNNNNIAKTTFNNKKKDKSKNKIESRRLNKDNAEFRKFKNE